MSTPAELLTSRTKAGARYAAAVIELRAAFGDLGAIDRLLALPSFGQPPEVVPLRHPTYAPEVSGSFADDIRAALATRTAD